MRGCFGALHEVFISWQFHWNLSWSTWTLLFYHRFSPKAPLGGRCLHIFFSPSNKKGHFNLNKGTKKWQHLSGNYMSWDFFFFAKKPIFFVPKSPTSQITYNFNCFLLPELESHPSYLREDVFKWWFHSKHTFLIASHLPIMEMLVVIYSFP